MSEAKYYGKPRRIDQIAFREVKVPVTYTGGLNSQAQTLFCIFQKLPGYYLLGYFGSHYHNANNSITGILNGLVNKVEIKQVVTLIAVKQYFCFVPIMNMAIFVNILYQINKVQLISTRQG